MSTTALRPLGVGEILDVAIKAYTKNARTLITIGAIIGIPFQLLNGVIQLSTVSSADEISTFMFDTGNSVHLSRARIAGAVLSVLIGLVVNLVLTAATVKAVSDAYLGKVPDVRDSLRFAVRRIRSLFWLYIVLGFGLGLAFVALIIPGIWLYVAWSVATPVLLLEDVRATAALRRSFRLVRGRWWPTAAVLIVAGLIVSIAGGVVSGLLSVIPSAIDGSSVLLAVFAATLAGSVATALVHPLQSAITTVLYFDLRVRTEGFDLALLAAGLGLPEAELPLYPLPPLAGYPAADGGEAPPFWPPPPGWKPSAAAPSGEPDAAPSGEPDAVPPGWPPLPPPPERIGE
ncbi:MAG: hypothetical protein ACR2KV_15535 [Solirubrobacteraceae bacterium]